MSAQTLHYLLIAIASFEFVLELVLGVLNQRHKPDQLPEELSGAMDSATYERSKGYHRENYRVQLLTSSISFLLFISVLGFGLLGSLADYISASISQPILSSLAFFAVIAVVSDFLSTPASWYQTFSIEANYGFNKTTPKLFWMDKFKAYALGGILGTVIMGSLLWLIFTLGSGFWIYFWLIATILMVLLNVFYTSWIVPLFNTLTPLATGELRAAIEQYCRKVDFPLSNLYIIDGSKRSTKANAFFSGMGSKKKIVLYDTLVNEYSIDEIVAVLAHEVGHYKKKHVYFGLAMGILSTGFMLWLLSKVVYSETLSLALGANGLHAGVNLVAFALLYSPVSTLVGLLGNLLSRKNEYEADAYAVQTSSGFALQAALKKLHVDSLSNPTPHPWYVFMHYSHPTLIQRVRAMQALS